MESTFKRSLRFMLENLGNNVARQRHELRRLSGQLEEAHAANTEQASTKVDRVSRELASTVVEIARLEKRQQLVSMLADMDDERAIQHLIERAFRAEG